MPYDEGVKAGLIEIIGDETDRRFMANVIGQINDKETVAKVADTFKMVYTPFHGCGYKLVPEALRALGIKHLICEPKQMVIDGINTDGIKAVTGLRFLDMKGGDLGAVSLDSTDGLFPVILYNKAGDLFAIGDRAVISLDGDGKTRWELKFSSVAGACLTAGGKLAVLAGGAGGMRLAVYSAAGKELAACDVDDGAKSVSAGGGLLAVSAQKEAAFYNEKCRPVGKYTSKYDITDVYFFSRKQAAVVMKNQVTVINIG